MMLTSTLAKLATTSLRPVSWKNVMRQACAFGLADLAESYHPFARSFQADSPPLRRAEFAPRAPYRIGTIRMRDFHQKPGTCSALSTKQAR